MDSKIQKYLSKIGKTGGQNKSEKKRIAAKQNIQKALQKRWGDLDQKVKNGCGH